MSCHRQTMIPLGTGDTIWCMHGKLKASCVKLYLQSSKLGPPLTFVSQDCVSKQYPRIQCCFTDVSWSCPCTEPPFRSSMPMEWQVTKSAVPRVIGLPASPVPARFPCCCWHAPLKGHETIATFRRASHLPRKAPRLTVQASLSNGTEETARDISAKRAPREGASTDLSIIWARLVKVSLHLPSKPACSVGLQVRSSERSSLQLGVPYWQDPERRGKQAPMGAGWGRGSHTGADRCQVGSSEWLPDPVHISDAFPPHIMYHRVVHGRDARLCTVGL